MDNQIPLVVFGIDEENSMLNVVEGKDMGTKVR